MNDRDKLNTKAKHYRKLARQMMDQRMVEVLEELAREYEQAAEGQPHARVNRPRQNRETQESDVGRSLLLRM